MIIVVGDCLQHFAGLQALEKHGSATGKQG
jgi:hypothetical protein